MKDKIAIAAALAAATSFSFGEIAITDNLSFEGFVDMSYSTYQGELDVDGIGDLDESDNSFGIDQVEISWLFDFDKVTGQIDLEYEEAGDDLEVEQAFATYHLDGGGAITAGRFASMLGFEAFEPTGLYQFSFAYGAPGVVGDALGLLGGGIGDDDVSIVLGTVFPLPGYYQGVKYTYENDEMFFGISLQDGIYSYGDRLGGDDSSDGTAPDGGGFGIEVAAAFDLGDGLTWFLGGAYEDGDGYSTTNIGTEDTTAWILNTYVTFETGAWVFAAELNYGENEWDSVDLTGTDFETESFSGLLMANFAYSDAASVTGRISYVDYTLDPEVGDVELEALKFTLAHNYAFTDNLALVTEVSYTDGDFEEDAIAGLDGDFEELLGAVELIFTF